MRVRRVRSGGIKDSLKKCNCIKIYIIDLGQIVCQYAS